MESSFLVFQKWRNYFATWVYFCVYPEFHRVNIIKNNVVKGRGSDDKKCTLWCNIQNYAKYENDQLKVWCCRIILSYHRPVVCSKYTLNCQSSTSFLKWMNIFIKLTLLNSFVISVPSQQPFALPQHLHVLNNYMIVTLCWHNVDIEVV